MRRPWWVLVPSVTVLVVLGSPVAHMRLANGGITSLPPSSPARQGTELLASAFPAVGGNAVNVVVDYHTGSPFQGDHVATAFALSRRLAGLPGVKAIRSYVDADAAWNLGTYQAIYAQPPSPATASAFATADRHPHRGSHGTLRCRREQRHSPAFGAGNPLPRSGFRRIHVCDRSHRIRHRLRGLYG